MRRRRSSARRSPAATAAADGLAGGASGQQIRRRPGVHRPPTGPRPFSARRVFVQLSLFRRCEFDAVPLLTQYQGRPAGGRRFASRTDRFLPRLLRDDDVPRAAASIIIRLPLTVVAYLFAGQFHGHLNHRVTFNRRVTSLEKRRSRRPRDEQRDHVMV